MLQLVAVEMRIRRVEESPECHAFTRGLVKKGLVVQQLLLHLDRLIHDVQDDFGVLGSLGFQVVTTGIRELVDPLLDCRTCVAVSGPRFGLMASLERSLHVIEELDPTQPRAIGVFRIARAFILHNFRDIQVDAVSQLVEVVADEKSGWQ